MSISDVAGQVVELVKAAAPAAEAEVVADHTTLALTRFANSFIHQNVVDSTTSVRLRLHLDGRTATGSTTVTATDGLKDLVARTVTAARLTPPDPLWPGLAPAEPIEDPPTSDRETQHASPDDRAARVRAFVEAAGGLETAGYCSTTHWGVAFANSAGQLLRAESTEAAMDAIARRGTADGVARLASTRLVDIDGSVLGTRAATKARAGTDPVELPAGRYEVVLEPTAVYDLLQQIALYGFNAKAVAERRSFVELGTEQFDPAVTLIDDPATAGGAGLAFDTEGTPRHALTVIGKGVPRALAHDRRTAAQAGVRSTGHALPGGASWGALFTNLILQPANDSTGVPAETPGPAADAAVAALVAQVGRGLLVTDNWYTRVLDPRSLVVTGLTRNGVWLIEDGEVTRPVQNLRFTQSYPQALAPGGVLGIGTHAPALPSGWGAMTYRAPALRLASWNYTGNAKG